MENLNIISQLIIEKDNMIQQLKYELEKLNNAELNKQLDKKKKNSEWRTQYYRERYQNDPAFRERIKQQKCEYARKKREQKKQFEA